MIFKLTRPDATILKTDNDNLSAMDNQKNQRPEVGVGVLLFRGATILLGRRKSDGVSEGRYAGPAGHLEYGESFEEGIRREVREETGGMVRNLKFLCVINLEAEGHHYVDVGFMGEWEGGDPELCEPDRCGGWGWYALDDLPSPLGEFDMNFIEAHKTGRNYFDN